MTAGPTGHRAGAFRIPLKTPLSPRRTDEPEWSRHRGPLRHAPVVRAPLAAGASRLALPCQCPPAQEERDQQGQHKPQPALTPTCGDDLGLAHQAPAPEPRRDQDTVLAPTAPPDTPVGVALTEVPPPGRRPHNDVSRRHVRSLPGALWGLFEIAESRRRGTSTRPLPETSPSPRRSPAPGGSALGGDRKRQVPAPPATGKRGPKRRSAGLLVF
jgi:hypothetical protein